MNLPTLMFGIANPENDAAIAAAVADGTVEQVAKTRNISRTAVRNALGRHRSVREFDLFLDQTIAPVMHIRVCHVIGTDDGAVKARTSNLFPTQERAIEAARAHWDALQLQLQAVRA